MKFERAFLTAVGRDGREIAICLQNFLFVNAFQRAIMTLTSLANTLGNVGPDF